MDLFSDDYLSYWRRVYNETAAIRERGILLNTFLLDPQAIYDQSIDLPKAEPLLPAQEQAMRVQCERELVEGGR